MKNFYNGLFSIIFFLLLSFDIYSQEDKRNYVLNGTEIREVKSRVNNQEYELLINLPYSYEKDDTKKYPVVFFCDGFYDFALFFSIYGQQIYDKTITECIMVGFSYKGKNPDYGKLRRFDYTPTIDTSSLPSGGAPQFLNVIEKEFIPFIEKNYRVDTSFRVLCGSSLGGLFTLYAMFTKTGLFDAYVSISPAVIWDNFWLFNLAQNFRKSQPELPVYLYLTGADRELPDLPIFIKGIVSFDSLLTELNFRNFRYSYRLIDEAYHSSSKPEGFTRGLQFVFAPLLKIKNE